MVVCCFMVVVSLLCDGSCLIEIVRCLLFVVFWSLVAGRCVF